MLCVLLVMPWPSFASDWSPLRKGLEYKKLEVVQDEGMASIHVFKIDPKRFSLKPITSETNSSVKNLLTQSNALIAVNANFFDESGKILGLVKRDKKVIHPIKRISWWAVYCERYQKGAILHSNQVKSGYCDQAIQAGPRLVVDGKIPNLKDNNSHKTAIGIDQKGSIYLAVTMNRISILTLANIFQAPKTKGGLGCTQALNLDGGSSSQLYASIDHFELDLPTFIKIPVALGVFAR